MNFQRTQIDIADGCHVATTTSYTGLAALREQLRALIAEHRFSFVGLSYGTVACTLIGLIAHRPAGLAAGAALAFNMALLIVFKRRNHVTTGPGLGC